MAKGRTTAPLTIVVAPEWEHLPEVAVLREQGHTVLIYAGVKPDLILHPAAHRWALEMGPYLPAAIKTARARKREEAEL